MTETEWWTHGTTDRDVAGNLEGWRRWWNRRPGGHAHVQVSLRPSAPGASFYDDDAVHSLSTDGRDEVEVVAKLVESVMRTRMRRSGRIDWQDAVGDA